MGFAEARAALKSGKGAGAAGSRFVKSKYIEGAGSWLMRPTRHGKKANSQLHFVECRLIASTNEDAEIGAVYSLAFDLDHTKMADMNRGKLFRTAAALLGVDLQLGKASEIAHAYNDIVDNREALLAAYPSSAALLEFTAKVEASDCDATISKTKAAQVLERIEDFLIEVLDLTFDAEGKAAADTLLISVDSRVLDAQPPYTKGLTVWDVSASPVQCDGDGALYAAGVAGEKLKASMDRAKWRVAEGQEFSDEGLST